MKNMANNTHKTLMPYTGCKRLPKIPKQVYMFSVTATVSLIVISAMLCFGDICETKLSGSKE